jgi:hypothetical protein
MFGVPDIKKYYIFSVQNGYFVYLHCILVVVQSHGSKLEILSAHEGKFDLHEDLVEGWQKIQP